MLETEPLSLHEGQKYSASLGHLTTAIHMWSGTFCFGLPADLILHIPFNYNGYMFSVPAELAT